MLGESEEASGPFQLDPEVMKSLELENVNSAPMLPIKEFDISFLYEEVVMPSLSDTRAK